VCADIVSGLGASQVTTKGNQKVLLDFLRQSVFAIQKGETATTIDKVVKSLKLAAQKPASFSAVPSRFCPQ
jgi:uncharacterized protein YaaW (UPF0174 family)